MSENQYSLRQRDILTRLDSDQEFFKYAIAGALVDIAAQYHCKVDLSPMRIRDVFDFWKGDIRRTKKEGFSQVERNSLEEFYDVELDHFKQASFLAFWIRRLSPIIAIDRMSVHTSLVDRTHQERFFGFANEIGALYVGLQVCGFYEEQKWMKHRDEGGAVGQSPIAAISSKFADWNRFRDFVMILRHKTMSPHALNLIFRSLFLS